MVAQLDMDHPGGHSELLSDKIVPLIYQWRALDPRGRALSNAGGGWQSQADLFATFGRFGGVPTSDIDAIVELFSVLRSVVYSAVVDTSTSMASVLWKFLDRGVTADEISIDNVVIQDAWANINAREQYNTKHGHGHLLAGVVYLINTTGCNENTDEGWLEFSDPRIQIVSADNQWWGHRGAVRIKPRDGMIVLFPGYATCCSRQSSLQCRQPVMSVWVTSVNTCRWLPHRVIPHSCNHDRISLAFNVVLDFSDSSTSKFAASRPRSLFQSARLLHLHNLRAFETFVVRPSQGLEFGALMLPEDPESETNTCRQSTLLSTLQPPVLSNTGTREIMRKIEQDDNCWWNKVMGALSCRVEDVAIGNWVGTECANSEICRLAHSVAAGASDMRVAVSNNLRPRNKQLLLPTNPSTA